jgi:hypothetical protein
LVVLRRNLDNSQALPGFFVQPAAPSRFVAQAQSNGRGSCLGHSPERRAAPRRDRLKCDSNKMLGKKSLTLHNT